MQPKCIILKTFSKSLSNSINAELAEIPSVRFFSWKINGYNTTTIKCHNYYKNFAVKNTSNFYGSYIYLYTNLSLLLCDIIFENYENLILKRILKSQYFYFSKTDQSKILNISNMLLTAPAYSSCDSIYQLKKDLLFSNLLSHFRRTNAIDLESFINFEAPQYYYFLEEILNNSINLFLHDKNCVSIIEFILQNLLY